MIAKSYKYIRYLPITLEATLHFASLHFLFPFTLDIDRGENWSLTVVTRSVTNRLHMPIYEQDEKQSFYCTRLKRVVRYRKWR